MLTLHSTLYHKSSHPTHPQFKPKHPISPHTRRTNPIKFRFINNWVLAAVDTNIIARRDSAFPTKPKYDTSGIGIYWNHLMNVLSIIYTKQFYFRNWGTDMSHQISNINDIIQRYQSLYSNFVINNNFIRILNVFFLLQITFDCIANKIPHTLKHIFGQFRHSLFIIKSNNYQLPIVSGGWDILLMFFVWDIEDWLRFACHSDSNQWDILMSQFKRSVQYNYLGSEKDDICDQC